MFLTHAKLWGYYELGRLRVVKGRQELCGDKGGNHLWCFIGNGTCANGAGQAVGVQAFLHCSGPVQERSALGL